MALNLDTLPSACSWNMYAGDINRQTLQFQLNGMPMDLTGYEMRAQARTEPMATEVAITAVVTVDEPTGTVVISWDGEEMRSLLDARGKWSGFWDLQMVEPGETLPRTLLAGPISITSDVTRGAP